MRDLRAEALKYKEKLQKIKVVVFDVDGILTNGMVYYAGQELGFNRHFYVPDGYGIKVLLEAGIKVGIITGGDSVGVRKRFELLKVNYLFLGNEDKREAFRKIKEDMGIEFEQMLYMGDEHFDMPLLKKAGFAATAPHANPEVLEICDYVTHMRGGEGCVREVIDLLRYAQGIVPKIEYM
ncbi:MAG: KdsC family phosphatase [Bacteriovoracaceae bacterium]